MTTTMTDELVAHLSNSNVDRPAIEIVLSALSNFTAVIPFDTLPRAGWVSHDDGTSGLLVQRKDGGVVRGIPFTPSMLSAELAMEALHVAVVTVLAVEHGADGYVEARASYTRAQLVETAVREDGIPAPMSVGVL